MPTTSDFERMLQAASLRVTGPRLTVLRAVHGHLHADTDSISGVVREDLGGAASLQAIYDVLRALTAAGLARRIQPMSSVARYEAEQPATRTETETGGGQRCLTAAAKARTP